LKQLATSPWKTRLLHQ